MSAAAEAAPAALLSIWNSPKIPRSCIEKGRVWTCAWCPNNHNGNRPKPFASWNSCKALYHVLKMTEYSIHPCSGLIPHNWIKVCSNLYLRQVVMKEKRDGAKDQLSIGIWDMQEDVLSAITPSTNRQIFDSKYLFLAQFFVVEHFV
jgi:hypothetical protein